MFKENFERLCSKIGESPSSVCDSIGLSRTMYSKWNDESVPRKVTLIKIADYFGVTPESLLAENEQKKDPAQMSREKNSRFAQKCSQMSEDELKVLEQFADYLLEKREKKSPDNSTGQ